MLESAEPSAAHDCAGPDTRSWVNWSCVERFEADVPMVEYVACALPPETDLRVGWREIEEVPC
jgi:hypothetical protein